MEIFPFLQFGIFLPIVTMRLGTFMIGLIAFFVQYLDVTTAQLAQNESFSSERNASGVRIVGGQAINIRRVPWQAAVLRNGIFICGGSVISRDWVLTAGHCVALGGAFAVRAGSTFLYRHGQYRVARLVVLHAAFNPNTYTSDIGMIRVRNSFQLTRNLRPIALARRGRRLPQRFYVSGWGSVAYGGSTTDRLRGVTVARYNRNQCIQRYLSTGFLITNTMLCAGQPGRDVCQGDSGGPLVRNRIQYGIVSVGMQCSNPPSVFTNVRIMTHWIRRNVNRWGGRMPRFM